MIRDCALWLLCWTCYQIYMFAPWPMVRGGFGSLILPHAGRYAYSPSWADFRARPHTEDK